MECPICLEIIGRGSILGRIHGCLHTYHRHCVEQWSEQSNSCPTCRKSFYGIDFVAFETPQVIISTVSIKDRLLSTDAIDQIPAEFVISPQAYASQQNHQNSASHDPENSHFGVCLICSSAQYTRRRNNNMVACISCGSKFHTACLGHSDEPAWFCPVCDCHQEFPVTVARSSPVSTLGLAQNLITRRRTNAAPRTSNITDRRGRLLLSETMEMPESVDSVESVESVEFNAEPLFSVNPRPQTAAWNGGALLRRRARELQNMTAEERSSWSMLESARRGDLGEETNSRSPTSSAPKRKRRPRVSPLDTTSANTTTKNIDNGSNSGSESSPINISDTGNQQGTSRIASLMSQIRARSSIPQNSESPTFDAHRSTLTESKPPTHIAVNASISSQSRSQSPVNAQIDSTVQETPRPLSLEEKSKVQTHVRNNLRPLYHNSLPNTRRIVSEDDYIRINKGISRKVYSQISSLYLTHGSTVYQKLFGESEDDLRRLVDSCVEGWPFD